ncbi:MAG: family 16 glycosylhydrolase [Bacteroidota bacterium]|nr:family 16 glycosylhydrolase [Bacteroidota bacterium]
MRKFTVLILALATVSCSKKQNTSPSGPSSTPTLTVNNVQQERDSVATTNFSFSVSVSTPSSSAITFQYSTQDGSAKAGTDYTAESATVTIPPNQSYVSINIPVTGDSLRENPKSFYVSLSNPTNATLGATSKGTGVILCDGLYIPVDSSGYRSPLSYPGYNLVWDEEFNEGSLDQNSWNFETGGNGWGNNELENYTNNTKNCFITQRNYLVIEARYENLGNNHYTSARIQTLGKREFQYGRVDIRAKLPSGQGLWPALWMLGSNINATPWPACGEIDMMEVLGQHPATTYGTLHWGQVGTGGLQKGSSYTLPTSDFSQQFHVFSTIWTADSIQWRVDDTPYFTALRTDITGNNPFDQPFFFIFNVAVGGNWPGAPDGTTTFPQRMIVDYIRVFQ